MDGTRSSRSSFSLVARDLAREHGSFTVLDGVDVSIGPRTRLGVVGPNGVGKSTLLRLLAGVEHPDRGTIMPTPPGLRVGYLPQEPERSDETLFRFLAMEIIELWPAGAGDKPEKKGLFQRVGKSIGFGD